MNREELKAALLELCPSVIFDETGEFLNAEIPNDEFHSFMKSLREKNNFCFDSLFCLTCVDWKTHFTMVYHLLSREHKHQLVVKVKLTDRDHAEVETVCDIWKTAEFHEREVFDLFGVKFRNHPDLRRLFLDDNWPGFPLRKDYTDINMIEL
ncbi:MAG: NADH-quinone oxidoreductase subunit C [Bacteroidetes bacterium]|nr:NADH-quinone oxidoreductase subunit C [Bacteroidota bacterium]